MPVTDRRSLFVTIFGVIGTFWFSLHALEYVFARYDAIGAFFALPAPFGVESVFGLLPGWAEGTLTATIWLGLLGAFLLLLGERASVLVLTLTLFLALATLGWTVWAFVSEGIGMTGPVQLLPFVGAQTLLIFGLWLYARTAKRYGSI